MEKELRKPFQGVINVFKFNWHLFAFAIVIIILNFIVIYFTDSFFDKFFLLINYLIIVLIFNSLFITYYVYDYSDLYSLEYFKIDKNKKIINFITGFDEISEIAVHKFKPNQYLILNYFDSLKEPKVSIVRANKNYELKDFDEIKDFKIIENKHFDYFICFLSLHEVRNEKHRIALLNKMYNSLKDDGKVFIVEHLRDINNFFAYNIGFFHFLTKKSWINSFKNSNFKFTESKVNPFISLFILNKNGNSF
jgi:hypothetical protein